MDILILQTNFVHNDEGLADEFSLKWKKEYQGSVTTEQIVRDFRAFSKKFMEPQCPVKNHAGWKQAQNPLSDLRFRMSEQVRSGLVSTQFIHEMLFPIIIDWFHYGPATIHIDVMTDILHDTDLAVDKFMTSLRGDDLLKLVKAVTSPVVKREDTPDGEFYSCYRDFMDKCLRMGFVESQLFELDIMNIMLDFAFHLFLDYTHLPDQSIISLSNAAKNVLRIYSKPWAEYSDVPRLKSYIKKHATLASTHGFPRNKEVADLFYESLTSILKQMKKPGKIEIFCNDVFDVLEVVSHCQGEEKYVVKAFSAGVYFFDQRDPVKDRMTVFETVVPRYNILLDLINPVFLRETRLAFYTEKLLELSYGKKKEANSIWVSLIAPLMRQTTPATIDSCKFFIGGKIKWKDHQDAVNEIFHVVKQLQVPSIEKKAHSKSFCDCISSLMSGLEKARILKNFGEKIMNLGIHLLELRDEDLFGAAEKMGEHIEINVKEKKNAVMDGMQRVHVVIKDENMPWDTKWGLRRAVIDVIEGTVKGVQDGKIFSDKDFKLFTDMCITCLEKEIMNLENGNLSSHFHIAMVIMTMLLKWLGQVKKVDLAKGLIPLLLSKLEEDDEKVWECVGRHLANFAQEDATVIAPYTDQLIKLYLENENAASYINTVYTIFSSVEVKLKDHQFQELMKNMLELEDRDSSMMLPMIFLLMAKTKRQAELFTDENIRDIIKVAKSTSKCHGILIQVVQEFSKRRPGKLINYLDLLLDNNGWDERYAIIRIDILGALAIYDKSVIAKKVLDYYIGIVKTTQDTNTLLTALNCVRLIGYNNLGMLKARRQDIEKLKMNDLNGENMKQSILDMIDGKTSEDVVKLLKTQQEELNDLRDKVEDVEITVTAVVEELGEQKTDLKNVKNEVVEHSNNLDQIKETVENTVAKVEEIDQKTLSHAPYWSRDISKLLNPPTEHDWRLLSSRLGYDNADIRGWAQQADPCMAMLNEWYATRKTSEASFAILNNLQEMNRVDASLIVENAMKKAEAVVEDEEFEYASPPEIFLSYQWGHQDEVKLLHRHLSMAGYDCWMDIGQMGGGDKLFEKIDSGMRAAKLVISCVTSKYAKSPNCNREVNLAVGVKKTIIPLLLESCPWPPPGSMGPLFSESLYIQFFQTGNEETEDERYWPVEKFQELLMQLSVNGLTPDQNKIEPMYRDWWMPLQEEIKIDKSKTRDGGKKIESKQTESDDMPVENPEVFISYQWGKQKNIIKLYQQLTSLGYSCWLDIKQMGGGDALYDKIDRGIRGCKVVLSCVTNKYALSANCRREVSLTDALKKPMLPLLLDEMTWPPSGPMSMIMTQLLYIDFHEESAQTKWDGPQFEELIRKINTHLPKPVAARPTSTTKESSIKSQTKKSSNSDKKPAMSAPKENPKKTQTEKSNNSDKKTELSKPKELNKPEEETPKPDREAKPPPAEAAADPPQDNGKKDKPPIESQKPKDIPKPQPSNNSFAHSENPKDNPSAGSQKPKDIPKPQPSNNSTSPSAKPKGSKSCSVL